MLHIGQRRGGLRKGHRTELFGGYKAGHFKTKLEKRMEAYASHVDVSDAVLRF